MHAYVQIIISFNCKERNILHSRFDHPVAHFMSRQNDIGKSAKYLIICLRENIPREYYIMFPIHNLCFPR